jgi:hypothetical protein
MKYRTTTCKLGSDGKRIPSLFGTIARLSVSNSILHAAHKLMEDAATHDLDEFKRTGTRSVSLGERPYLDPKSTGRREALRAAAKA